MKFGSRRMVQCVIAVMIPSLIGLASAWGQVERHLSPVATAGEKPLMAEQVFKNVQLLKGISVKEFMETMGFFAAATNKTCTTCHGDESGGSWERYADDPPQKQTARKMMIMADALNRTYFGGKREVTCYSCHRNAERPKVTPILAEQYGTPLPDDPDVIPQQAPGAPSPDQVLDKYVQALGGPQKLATFTSFVAKGSYEGYDVHPGAIAAGAVYELKKLPRSLGVDLHGTLRLLVRMVRYTNLPVGFIPTEIDYADYRDVSGVKIPFRVTKTWVDGRSVTELSSIQLNVPIDAAKFARPVPPALPRIAASR